MEALWINGALDSMNRHENRIALVTGAARGIGFAIAETLARGGAHVMLADVANGVHERAKELRSAGWSVESAALDVGSASDIRTLTQSLIESHGRVDILVNNAGIAPKKPNGLKSLVHEIDDTEWERVLGVNLTGTFILCKACVPSMKLQKWGRIINLTSVAARAKSDISAAHYCASKAGLIGFSRVLANEVGPYGIRVNCIAPGRIMTPLAAVAGDEVNQGYIKLIPTGRLGTPADVARVASFLASDDVDFVTGSVIDVNGGSYMA
jgi:3-oxoacyl-[acyl-carrier protein] reductase